MKEIRSRFQPFCPERRGCSVSRLREVKVPENQQERNGRRRRFGTLVGPFGGDQRENLLLRKLATLESPNEEYSHS